MYIYIYKYIYICICISLHPENILWPPISHMKHDWCCINTSFRHGKIRGKGNSHNIGDGGKSGNEEHGGGRGQRGRLRARAREREIEKRNLWISWLGDSPGKGARPALGTTVSAYIYTKITHARAHTLFVSLVVWDKWCNDEIFYFCLFLSCSRGDGHPPTHPHIYMHAYTCATVCWPERATNLVACALTLCVVFVRSSSRVRAVVLLLVGVHMLSAPC